MDLLHYFQILLLSVVEGVTEFLPISSTGHLLIAESLLKTKQNEVFNLAIQGATILAAIFIFRGRMEEIVFNLGDKMTRAYAGKVITSVVITCSLAFLFRDQRIPTMEPVAWSLFFGGVLILLVEYLASGLLPREEVTWLEAVAMGLAQVLAAVFPGASRPACTIMVGLLLGLKRPQATEFSFLIGIPTLCVDGGWKLFEIFLGHSHENALDLNSESFGQILMDSAIGFFVSGLFAFVTIKWLIRFVQYQTFNGFAIYRLIVGGGLLVGIYSHLVINSDDHGSVVQPEIPSVADPVPTPQTNAPPALPPDTNDAVPALPLSSPTPTPQPSPTPTPADTPTPTATPTPTRKPKHHHLDLNNIPVAPAAPADQ